MDVMSMYIHLVYPAGVSLEDVQWLRNAVLNDQHYYLYDSPRALSGSVDSRAAKLARFSLSQADVCVAILPPSHEDMATPAEVLHAKAFGVPVILVCAQHRQQWVLDGAGVTPVKTKEDAWAAIHRVEPRVFGAPARPRVMWKHVEHGTRNEDLDVEPKQAHHDDAGFDLSYDGHAIITIPAGGTVDIPCGVAMEFPANTWGFLVGRSSTFRNRGLLVNPAIIDPGYRGHLFAIVRNISHHRVQVKPGERVAQIVPLPALAPRMDLEYTQELSNTARGEKGFGSSGL